MICFLIIGNSVELLLLKTNSTRTILTITFCMIWCVFFFQIRFGFLFFGVASTRLLSALTAFVIAIVNRWTVSSLRNLILVSLILILIVVGILLVLVLYFNQSTVGCTVGETIVFQVCLSVWEPGCVPARDACVLVLLEGTLRHSTSLNISKQSKKILKSQVSTYAWPTDPPTEGHNLLQRRELGGSL